MIPRFQLPSLLTRAGKFLPQWPHAAALTLALNAAVKAHLLPADSLALLEGRTFLVAVNDAGTRATFTFANGMFRPLFNFRGQPDLTFSANLSAFLRLLAREEDPDTLFFNRELSIEGDTELGLIVKNMLEAVELPKLPLRSTAK
jgi:predicted lipid carrier protein YhbT